MGMVSELIVSVGVEGTGAVIAALKEVDGAQVALRDSTKQTGTITATETQNMGMNWADLVTGINQGMQVVNMVIGGAKKVFDFAEEGASLSALETRFDRLSESIGMTKDTLLLDLKAATRGVKSDAELMQLATDMIGLGFAKSSDQAIRLASVAGALDMNMNQLALTLANQTTMRFDQLGVSIDGFDEKLSKLKATGMDTNQAFKEAFLLQAEEQIAKVGHVADTAAGSFEKLHSSFSDFVNNTKKDLGEGFGKETADMLSQYFTRFNMGDAFADYNKQFSAMGISVSDLNKEWNANRNLLGWFKDEKEASNILSRMQERLDAYWNSVNGYEQPDNGEIFSLSSGDFSTQDLMPKIDIKAMIGDITGWGNRLDFVASNAQKYSDVMSQISQKQAQYAGMNPWQKETEAGRKLKEEIDGLNASLANLGKNLQTEMLLGAIKANGEVTKQEFDTFVDHLVKTGQATKEAGEQMKKDFENSFADMKLDAKGNVFIVDNATPAIEAIKDAIRGIERHIGITVSVTEAGKLSNFGIKGYNQAIGGPVYPGHGYVWNEPGREGELLLPSQYGRVASSTEVAQMLREVTRPGDGISAGQQAQVVNNNHTEVVVNANIASDYDVDKLTREIVRRINA